jgi:hypothetical protein
MYFLATACTNQIVDEINIMAPEAVRWGKNPSEG